MYPHVETLKVSLLIRFNTYEERLSKFCYSQIILNTNSSFRHFLSPYQSSDAKNSFQVFCWMSFYKLKAVDWDFDGNPAGSFKGNDFDQSGKS